MREELRWREPAEWGFIRMRFKGAGRPVALAGYLVLAVSLAGCNALELASPWRDRDIVIDGDARDWRGLTTYVEKNNIAVGVTNDDRNLFLCLHSPTREVAGQIVLRGLTVWFDPDGGGGKKLGFHCPIGEGEMPRPGGEKVDREEMKDKILEMIDRAAREVEVLGPDDKVYGRFATGDIQGLEIALGYTDGRIVYELKIPLEKTEATPYALGVNWKKKVGIGFVTPEVDMAAMREDMRDAMDGRTPPGGGRGSGMDGGGRGGGMPGGMRAGGMPEAVELWCRVELTPAPEDDEKSEE